MFVVVALSSVVRGINESFARDVAAAGPTSFFVYRRPIGGFQSCDPSDPNSCPERRNPAITIDEALGIERLAVHLRRDAARRQRRASSSTRIASLSAGVEFYTPNWTDVDGGDIYPGRSFTYAENAAAARVVIVNDKLAESLFGDSDPIDKQIADRRRQFTVIGALSLHGEPDGHADVGGRRRFAEGDRAVRDGPPPHATSGCAATTSS